MHINFSFRPQLIARFTQNSNNFYRVNINIPSQDTMNKNKKMVGIVLRISHASNRLSISNSTHGSTFKALVPLSTVCTCRSSSTSINGSHKLFMLALILIRIIWVITQSGTRLRLVLVQKKE